MTAKRWRPGALPLTGWLPRTNVLFSSRIWLFLRKCVLSDLLTLSLFCLFAVSFCFSKYLILFPHKLFLDCFVFSKFPQWIWAILWLHVTSFIGIIYHGLSPMTLLRNMAVILFPLLRLLIVIIICIIILNMYKYFVNISQSIFISLTLALIILFPPLLSTWWSLFPNTLCLKM